MKKESKLYFSYRMDKNFAKYGKILQEWVVLTKNYILNTLSSNEGNFVCTRTPKIAENVKKVSQNGLNLFQEKEK